MNLTIQEYITRVSIWDLDAGNVIWEYVEKVKNDTLNAYISIDEEYIATHIHDFVSRPLKAAPIAVKDLILTKWVETTFGSKMWVWYIPPYSATSFRRLEEYGWLMIGKTNLDEFAMWWSNENSAFGPVKNPHDQTRISWGSSWGSAAAVAADMCLAALWTDTWWSVRQPAALCGIVWTKWTFGRVSRYGVQAMWSFLDQVGTLTKTVDDAVLLMQTISGVDEHDATTCQRDGDISWWKAGHHGDWLQWFRLAVPKQYFDAWLEENVRHRMKEVLEHCTNLWAVVDWVDIPLLSYVIPTYYILMPAAASTNLARFDGIRFGNQSDISAFDSIFDYYAHMRDQWFGDEVKRRILTWTYVLSAGFYDAYYRKALKVRAKLQSDITALYETYDAIVWPTSPSVAWKIWAKVDDPIAMYLADIYTVTANLTWLPAMSVPVWTVVEEEVALPVWLQVMCRHWDEKTMFHIGWVIGSLYS